jgi:hypothetical protein
MEVGVSRYLLLFSLVMGPPLRTQAATTRATSELQFESSDARLVQAFQWAKVQALAYAHDGSDPVGPWYEAALPGRSAFCMRDVSHQSNGAAALGLYAANRNMLERFAASQSPKRDWAGYWEIDREGHPSPADYTNDDDFWYNLPANFDVLSSIVRMWQWTGDETYVTVPEFREFFDRTATDYLHSWDLEPDKLLTRPRIMNRRLTAGRYLEQRGIPSYTEGRQDFNLGTDLIAAEYRALDSLRLVALTRHETKLADQYANKTRALSRLIEQKAWSQTDHHFVGYFSSDGRTQGSGDQMILYFRATKDPKHIRAALSYIERPEYLKGVGIEEESYLAQTFYDYDEKQAAYDRIMDISSVGKERREYPEVSFSVVGAIVNGTMGIQVSNVHGSDLPVIRSISRLLLKNDTAKLSGLQIRDNLVDLEHFGNRRSSLTNHSGPVVHWQPMFDGRVSHLWANGRAIAVHTSLDTGRGLRSWARVDVPSGATVVVKTD